jgi:hypothetical protein
VQLTPRTLGRRKPRVVTPTTPLEETYLNTTVDCCHTLSSRACYGILTYVYMFPNWIDQRIQIAERLAEGQCGGTTAEAFLILSSVISGIAADLWPGTRIDRQRFVELWARYTGPALLADLISVPLLMNQLEQQKRYDIADRLRANNSDCFSPRGLPDTRVVTGEDVDVLDNEVQAVVPELTMTEIRRSSYPDLFYVHFRSGYVHEYQVGPLADAIIMSHTRSFITYGNFFEAPHRRINFEVSWVASVAAASLAGLKSTGLEGQSTGQQVGGWTARPNFTAVQLTPSPLGGHSQERGGGPDRFLSSDHDVTLQVRRYLASESSRQMTAFSSFRPSGCSER